MPTPEQQEYLDWVKLEKQILQTAFAKQILLGIAANGPAIDTSTTWFLAGLGATTALLVSNIDKLVPLVGKEGVITSICWFGLAGGFGLLAKGAYLRSAIFSKVSEVSQQNTLDLVREFVDEKQPKMKKYAEALGMEYDEEIPLKGALPLALSGQPWWAKWAARYGSRVASKFPNPELAPYGLAARFVGSQQMHAATMCIVGALAIINFLCFLSGSKLFISTLQFLFG